METKSCFEGESILPVDAELKNRHIKESGLCQICKVGDEALLHALVDCSHAKLFWSAAKEFLQVKLPPLHPLTWRADILCASLIPEDHIPKVITVIWCIWTSSNKWAHEYDEPGVFS